MPWVVFLFLGLLLLGAALLTGTFSFVPPSVFLVLVGVIGWGLSVLIAYASRYERQDRTSDGTRGGQGGAGGNGG